MGNVRDFDAFKVKRNIDEDMAWFEQFQTSPALLELLRLSMEAHSMDNVKYQLPFNVVAQHAKDSWLELDFRRSKEDPIDFQFGWHSHVGTCYLAGLSAMEVTAVPDKATSKAAYLRFTEKLFALTQCGGGVGSVGQALGFVASSVMALLTMTCEFHQHIDEDGDWWISGLIGDPTGPTGYEIFTICILKGAIERAAAKNVALLKTQMPKAGPSWENVRGGKIRAKIVSRKKPESPLFKKGTNKEINKWIDEVLTEEIVGDDREAMERYIRKLLAWHHHYAVHYNMEGWSYEVSWK